MNPIDLATFSGLTAAIVAIVAGIRKGWPSWTSGQEPRLALILGLILGVAAHVAHPPLFAAGAAGWISAVLQGIGAGIASQIVWDKGRLLVETPKTPPEVPKDPPADK